MLSQIIYLALAFSSSSFFQASALPSGASAPTDPPFLLKDLHTINSKIAPGATISYKQVRIYHGTVIRRLKFMMNIMC